MVESPSTGKFNSLAFVIFNTAEGPDEALKLDRTLIRDHLVKVTRAESSKGKKGQLGKGQAAM